FFFQAEDGIRDFHVTGVQTCALPISPTKFTSAPIMRWKRTQMSAWMYSMMWPMWNLPLAYGRAVVTKSWRAVMAAGAMGAAKPIILGVAPAEEARDGLAPGPGMVRRPRRAAGPLATRHKYLTARNTALD